MGIRFRIANWLLKDCLRNWLVVGVRLPLSEIKERSGEKIPKNLTIEADSALSIINLEATRAIHAIDELMEM